MNNERYHAVPAALPAQLPAINRKQGKYIALRIAKHFSPAVRTYWMRKWLVDGRRVWVSTSPTKATNHHKGLGRLVHDVSHEVFEAVYPDRKPHDPLHARYETDIAAYVAARVDRWFKPPQPKPEKPKPTKTELRSRKLIRVRASIVRWESKAKRAATALRKLKASERGLERAMYEHDLRPLTINGKPV